MGVKIAYLFDENMSPRLRMTLRRYYPDIDVQQIGDNGAPALGTTDAAILYYLERTRRVLVTDNRKSMPAHVRAHLAAGHHHGGIFVVSKHASFRPLADALFVYWDATEAEQWIDVTEWVAV